MTIAQHFLIGLFCFAIGYIVRIIVERIDP